MDATAEANRVKIGDLGLATLYTGNARAEQMSVIGTPEYMAPEFYSESYNQLVDIWAFGLVMLEMLSGKVPYHECNGATAQIFLKVSRGVLPSAFDSLAPGPCKDFIAACLLPASVRPSAELLLQVKSSFFLFCFFAFL
jgi:WNK lysine deficient protein kinase